MTTRNEKGQFTSKYDLGEYEPLYNRYSEWVMAHIEKNTTIDRLKAGVRAWLYWCEDTGVDPLDVEEDDVRRYILDNRSEADTTLIRRVASVSKYYHYHLNHPDSGVEIEENPTSDINLHKDYDVSQTAEYVKVLSREGRGDVIALPYERIRPLFNHAPGKEPATETRNKLICRLLWQTALRADELSRVRIDNIDLDDRDIRVRSSKLNREDHPKLYHRHVWWEEDLDYLMYRWMESHREQLSKYAEDSPYLFLTTHSEQMRPSHISRVVKEAAHNAGEQEPLTTDASGNVGQWLITAHRLRHSRITYLANETNMDLNFIRMMAGHAKLDTTLRYVNEDWDAAKNAYSEAVAV